MSISSTTSRNDYIGNGATSVYSYGFKIFVKTDLKVTKRDTTDVETLLVVDTDYTVLGVSSSSGGSITLTAGNLPTNYKLTIRRIRPVTQTTDIRNQGPTYPEAIEDAMDSLVMIDQKQQDEVDRSLKLPESVTGVSTALPVPSAGKVLLWDDAGTGITQKSPSTLPSSIVTIGGGLELISGDLRVSTFKDASKYSSIKAAVDAIGSTPVTLVIATSIQLATSAVAVTIPSTMSIFPVNPGVIAKGTATSLTINGPVVGNPMHQWLSGFAAGDVKFRDQFTGSITPVWWGYVIDNNNASVQTTNATALACWIQSVANSAGGYPMAELVLPAGEGFYSGSGLTVSYGQMLHIRGAAGGRYSAGGSAVSGRASMLSYTGTGTALTLDGTTGNFSGLRMDGIYLKGTSSAAKGLYINTCGGVSLDHCHVYGFSATNVRGVDIIHSQDISFDKCGFSGNYIGTFQDGAEATAENTTITYNKCAWVANTVGLIDYMTDTTILIAPLFSENKAEAVIVDYTQTTHGGSHFKIYGGYQSGNNATSAGYIIDIKGNGASGSTWSRGIEIDGLFMGSAGAAATGQIRLRNTRQAKLESLLFSSTLLQIVASRTDNLNLVLINVDDGQADSMIQDGSGNTVYWPHVGRSQAQTLASATALNIPSACRVAHVTGTTNITSLTGGWPGQVVTLIFDGILTLTDGNNIKIGGNFVTTADDSITLVYDGTNWYEGGARSVN